MTTFLTWCRRHLAWSNSRQSWEERLGTLGLLAAAFAVWWFRGSLLPVVQVILWSLLLLAAAILLRRGWLKLFGPVLFYDMVRSARRGRYILMRCLYSGLLFGLLWVVYNTAWRPYHNRGLTPWEAAQIAQSYFEAIMVVQLMAVLILTPAYVAGSIADEKTHKTLEFIMATDLRSREIVLSKLVSRLANLTVFILTGLPVLSFLQFLGGVDPNLVLAGFAATGLTMLGLGGVSILASTYCKRPRDAIAISYIVVLAYYALSFSLWFLQMLLPPTTAPFTWDGFFEAIFSWSLDWRNFFLNLLNGTLETLNAGNLPVILGEVQQAGFGGQLATVIPRLLGKYALFQGVVAAVCIGWSVLRLRPVAIRQMSVGKARRRRIFGFRRPRPVLGDLPMVWKELHIEGGLRFHWVAWLIMLVLVIATFLPALAIIYFWYWDTSTLPGMRSNSDNLRSAMNGWARTATVLVGVATLLAVAIRSAACVSSERDRQTLDSLLTTPMTANQIMGAKALGNVTAVRVAWLWLGGVWLLALLTGGLHPFALPFLMGAWLVYAFFLSMLGCWFSIISRTSQRAIVYTLLATIGLSIGHWLPWCCCMPVMMYGPGPGSGFQQLVSFQLGITPPVALGFLTFYDHDFREYHGPDPIREIIGFSVCGLFLWLCAGLFMWNIVVQRFRTLTQRGTEGMLGQYDQRQRHSPRRRDRIEEETLPSVIFFDEAGEPQPQGATLIDKTRDLNRPWGAKLIEEIQEQPSHRPPPEAQDTK